MDGTSLEYSTPITLHGERTVEVTAADLATLPTVESRFEIICSSGDRYTETWRGVPLEGVLEYVSLPEATTHVLAESVDGYRICIDVLTALDGILAFYRTGRPLAEDGGYESRFVAKGIGGPRTVKDVTRIEALELGPDEDPTAYEDFLLAKRE